MSVIEKMEAIVKQIDALISIFGPYTTEGERYIQGSKICYKKSIKDDAPEEAKQAYRDYQELLIEYYKIVQNN